MNTTADPEPETNPNHTGKPGGITAAWHLKVITGKEAQALLEMQNQAIVNLLTWAATHENNASYKPDGSRETQDNVPRETLELAA
jgi:hypothetical protein